MKALEIAQSGSRAQGGGIAAVGAVCMLMTACLPQVMHGPRVEEGTSVQLNMGVGGNLPLHEDVFGHGNGIAIAPSFYAGARKGLITGDGKPAVSVGAQVPLIGVFFLTDPEFFDVMGSISYLDVNVQPRRRNTPETEFSIGMMASTRSVAPYVQYGRMRNDSTSWFTTQQIMVTSGDDPLRIWMPSFNWRRQSKARGRAVTFTAGGGAGKVGSTTLYFFLLSANAELGLPKVK